MCDKLVIKRRDNVNTDENDHCVCAEFMKLTDVLECIV